jgi:hypothetical protein
MNTGLSLTKNHIWHPYILSGMVLELPLVCLLVAGILKLHSHDVLHPVTVVYVF